MAQSYGHTQEFKEKLEANVKGLLARDETADSEPLVAALSTPKGSFAARKTPVNFLGR